MFNWHIPVINWLSSLFRARRGTPDEIIDDVRRMARGRLIRFAGALLEPRGTITVYLGPPLWATLAQHREVVAAELTTIAGVVVQKEGGKGDRICVELAAAGEGVAGHELTWTDALSSPGAARPPEEGPTRRAEPWRFSVCVAEGAVVVLTEQVRTIGGGEGDYVRLPGLEAGIAEVWDDRGAAAIRSRGPLRVSGITRTGGQVLRFPNGGRVQLGEIVIVFQRLG